MLDKKRGKFTMIKNINYSKCKEKRGRTNVIKIKNYEITKKFGPNDF